MSKLTTAIRQAVYALECPIQRLADDAGIARNTLWGVINSKVKPRPRVAEAIAVAVTNELGAQITRRENEIKRMQRLSIEVRAAYSAEYGEPEEAER